MGVNKIEAQLRRELSAAAARMTPILGPFAGLEVEQAAGRAGIRLAMQLGDEVDDSERAGTVVDILNAIHGDGDPAPEWWATPLGMVCAASLGNEHAYSWTHSVAAAVLGVSKGTVSQLVARGTIAKHPDGGVIPSDVIRYKQERRPPNS